MTWVPDLMIHDVDLTHASPVTLRQRVEVHRIEYAGYLDEGGLRYRRAALVETPFLSQHGEPLMHELRHVCLALRAAENAE